MKNEIINAIDETIALLRQCEGSEQWIDRYTGIRRRLQDGSSDAVATQELYVLSAPRGFLGDYALVPKTNSGLSNAQVKETAWRLVERTCAAIDKWKTQ